MKKIIVSILILTTLSIFAGIFYLNTVILPVKAHGIIQKSVEEATGKKVSIGSLEASLISGLVLKDVSISDQDNTMLSVSEISFRPFLLPFFKKELIIPVIRVKSPMINMQRRSDGTFDIADLFKNPTPKAGDFKVIAKRVSIKDGLLHFTDNALAEPFKRDFKNLNSDIRFILPSKIRFESDCEMVSEPSTLVGAWGEYLIPDGSFTTKLTLTDASFSDFEPYYKSFNIELPEGRANVLANVKYSKQVITGDIDIRGKNILFTKGDISARLDSDLRADGSYDFAQKALKYSGEMSAKNMELDGIKHVGKVENMTGEAKFNESSFYAKNIKAIAFGVPFTADAYVSDYKAPILAIDINSELSLGALSSILKEDFKIHIPVDIRGMGKLYLKWEHDLKEPQNGSEINGYVDIGNAMISLFKNKPPLEIPSGQIQFTPKQLAWSDLDVKYRDTIYNTTGTLTNFLEPGIQLSISSRDLSVDTAALFGSETITISKFSGKYLDSRFSLHGEADISDKSNIRCAIAGMIETSIDDIKRMAKSSREKLDKMKLSGDLRAELKLTGKIADIKSCSIEAKIFSNTISIYDLKPVDVIIDYSQRDGVANMTRFHSFLYDGIVAASGRMDLTAAGSPYILNADITGVRIEGLKTATLLKDKDISGTLRCQTHIEGLYGDSATAVGSGRISIDNGKLWQLNLFKGLGVLLFSRDFSNVIFNEGQCSFAIKDKAIYTDDLELKSSLLNLYGSVKIGFDKTVSAALKSEFTDEAMSSGAVSNAAANIGKYSYVSIKGDLKEPKYAITPDVPTIVQGIAEKIFNN
jgi:hypothetical protein